VGKDPAPPNLCAACSVSGTMTFLKKLFSPKPKPGQRVRVCVECGMPVAEHKDWCSIFRTQQEFDRKAAAPHG
jgi:hypothetical protein